MLSYASEADIPPVFFSDAACSVEPGDDGGDGTLGFHETPPGFGRGTDGGEFPAAAAGFSNAAILSRNEPTLGFVGEAVGSDMI